MRKTQLAEHVSVYSLNSKGEINILTLIQNGKALLIDTGYPENAQELQSALAADGLTPEIILTSHFHPDHINGNYLFNRCKFMGSEHYKQNFELFEALNPTLDFQKPTTLIKHGQTMKYGSFELKFLNLPGHCRDLLVTIINDQWVHVADLLMFDSTGKHTLPYISYDGNVDDHVQSLEALKPFADKVIIPSHGPILQEKPAVLQAIEIRQHYLQQLKAVGKTARLVDCLSLPEEHYAYTSIHESNLKNIFG